MSAKFPRGWGEQTHSQPSVYMVQELLAFTLTYNGPQDGCLVKLCHRFALQCLDNVKMYKYAKFDKKKYTMR